LAARFAQQKKATDIMILDLRQISPLADFFVIASGSSDTHIRAIADTITNGLAERGVKVWHIEGYTYAHWILLDLVDVVVHIFDERTREYYGLERLWGDAPVKIVSGGN